MTTAPATAKTYIVERATGTNLEKIEVTADRVEQDTASSRVIFYLGDNAVGSFINIQAWYLKP